MKNCPSIIPLEPNNFTTNMWGGDWIPRLKNWPVPHDPVGESWEFSAHPHHPSHFKMRDGTSRALPHLSGREAHYLLGRGRPSRNNPRAPFLLKFIDAREDLSLQVHPSTSYARRHERDFGKTESWVILSRGRRPNEGFIYLGFNAVYARRFASPREFKQAFQRALRSANRMGPSLSPRVRRQAADLVLPFLNKIPVEPGQTYHLKPGTIHSIGKGVRLFEIQQSSDVTYRVWDWNRPDPKSSKNQSLRSRRLHFKKAFAVLNFKPAGPGDYLLKPSPAPVEATGGVRKKMLVASRPAGYALHRIEMDKLGSELIHRPRGRFSVWTLLEGEVAVRPQSWALRKDRQILKKGRSLLIPAFLDGVILQNRASKSILFKSYPLP